MIAPLDLTDEQSHIYKLLYKRVNLTTKIVKYTKEQLLVDSNPIFNLTVQKIRTILKYFIKENFLREIHKGSKGHPTVYEIVTIKELMFEQQLNNNQITAKQQLINSNEVVIPTVIEVKQQSNSSNVTTIQQLSNNPIKEKEKEKDKEKDKYIDLFNFYIKLDIVKHKALTQAMIKAIDLAIKQNSYSVEDCKTLLQKHKLVIEKTKSNQYPVKKRPLVEFFGQKIKDSTALICTQYELGGKFDFMIDDVKAKDPNKKVITRRDDM